MKKILLCIALILAVSNTNAQFRTLGLRMGFGGEVSAQIDAGPGRIEADLGMFHNFTNVTLAYQLVNEINNDFNWYYGLGGTAGFWNNGWGTSIGGVGVVGVEYNFKNVPIQLSIDWRPVVYIIKNSNVGSMDFWASGVGVRYRF